jgi:dephospho-CoA kinase
MGVLRQEFNTMIHQRIGIGGFMGAGKTTYTGLLCSALRSNGVTVTLVDADAEAKMIMRSDASLPQKLVDSFGQSVVKDWEIVYSSLGKLAFGSMPSLRRLNNIVHPLLLERLKELIFSMDADCMICDAALLPLWPATEWFDVLFWLKSSFEQRRARLLKKVNLTNEEITARMLLQQDLFAEPQKAPWTIISNQGTIEELQPIVQWFCASITKG